MQDSQLTSDIRSLINNVETVIVGKTDTVQMAVATLLAGGHMLIEDIPGVGKTMLAHALAKSLDCTFKRIQFTPDLLPADVTGVAIYDQRDAEFRFREGPIFANVVLADEINRATPKAQAALLECLEEYQVTVDGVTYPVPRPFFVVATENPIEYEGTYQLPEAQVDRFLTRVNLGYPSPDDEVDVLTRQVLRHPIEDVEPVLSSEAVIALQEQVRRVFVEDSLKDYIVQITNATRTHPGVRLGASPRGSIALMRMGQAMAAVAGRDYVIPDDIKRVGVICLGHRVILRPDYEIQGVTSQDVIQETLRTVHEPTGLGRRSR